VRKTVFFVLTLSFVVMAIGLGAALGAETPGPTAAISSPAHASVITGEKATVTVLFDAGPEAKVTAAELYVDGELHDSVAISPAVLSGSCKLTWRCGEFEPGKHTLAARVYDSSGHSRAVDVEVKLQQTAPSGEGTRLRVEIMAPTEGQEISGLTLVRVATDESRVRYVMLLIDDVFVALTNMPPFSYSLNTTRYLNGPHALRATAFDLSDTPTDSAPVNVIINNPGGRTEMRSQAGASTAQPTPAPGPQAPAGQAPPAQTAPQPASAPAASPPETSGAAASSAAGGHGAASPSAAEPAATAADPMPPQTGTAESDAALGISGSPAAPCMSSPRAVARHAVAPAATAGQAASSEVHAAMEAPPVEGAKTEPEPSRPAAAQVMASAGGQTTEAAAAPAGAVSEGPVPALPTPEAAEERGMPPGGVVQIAAAPRLSETAVTTSVELAHATAALEILAATASHGVIERSSPARGAQSISALPRMAALPAAPPRIQVSGSPQPPTAQVASTAAEAGVQVAALAPGIAGAAGSEPAPASPAMRQLSTAVRIARAPSPPVAVVTVTEPDQVLHTVCPGEQLGTIAAHYDVPVRVLARFNGLHANAELAAGESLRIPRQLALILNGQPVYSDMRLVNEGGISLAPFRAVIEHAGGAVHWIPANRQVRALAFSHDIRVTIGSRLALVDAKECMLETEAKLLRDRAMVPLGLFRDALGFKVTFDHHTGRIYLAAQ
jgi:LysM repeat protein